MIIRIIAIQISFRISFYFIFDLFYISGEPISPHLLCSAIFAVEYHSFISRASHLWQSQLVNNQGIFIKNVEKIYRLNHKKRYFKVIIAQKIKAPQKARNSLFRLYKSQLKVIWGFSGAGLKAGKKRGTSWL